MNVMGCSAPDFYVTVETGFQAVAPALLSLFVPGCTDIVKMKLGLSPWHRRGISGFLKDAAPPFAVGANKFLYKIGYFTAERGLYYFMLADVATQFVTTWQSLAFVAQQCPLPSAGTAYGNIAPFIYPADLDTLLTPAPIHNVGGMHTGAHGFTIFPGFQGTLNWSCEWDSWPERGQGVNVVTWMTEDDDPTPTNMFETNQPPSQPYNETIGHSSFDTLHNFVRKDYVLHVNNIGSVAAQCVKGTYSIYMSGAPSPVLPWGCKFHKTTVPFL